MRKFNITEIDQSLKYQGYLWPSDSKEPIILMDEKIPEGVFLHLPFIVEGYLYCQSKNGLSIKIKHIDGEYNAFAVDLDQIPSDRLTPSEFVAVKNTYGIKRIKSVQFWESISDPLCEGFKSLEPSWVAFNGFN